jgi:hypothetical protein
MRARSNFHDWYRLIDARIRGRGADVGQGGYTDPQKQSLSNAQY